MKAVEALPESVTELESLGKPLTIVQLLGVAGLIYLILIAIAAIIAPVLPIADPLRQDLATRFAPPLWLRGGASQHPLGTDQLGRDILSRVIYGGRVSLLVAVSAVAISAIVGTTLGLVAGYLGGIPGRIGPIVERLVMIMTEMALAIPGIILAIAAVALFGAKLRNLIIILSLFGWVVFARLARGIVLTLHRRPFVEAAVVLGAGHGKILVRHMLPYVLPQTIVVAALLVGFMILVESALSYLGIGVQPPTPSWGRMVSEGRDILSETPWVALFSGLAITLTVLAVNFAADLLRRSLTVSTAGEGQ